MQLLDMLKMFLNITSTMREDIAAEFAKPKRELKRVINLAGIYVAQVFGNGAPEIKILESDSVLVHKGTFVCCLYTTVISLLHML